MADSSSVDIILEFLRRNNFSKAEAALRSEISNQTDLNGFIQGVNLEEKYLGGKIFEEENGKKHGGGSNHGRSSQTIDEVSNEELIVKEIEQGTKNEWNNITFSGEQYRPGEPFKTRNKNLIFSNNSEDTVIDLYSWNFNSSNGSVDLYQKDAGIRTNDVKEYQVSSLSKIHPFEVTDTDRLTVKVGEETVPSRDRKMLASSSKANVGPKQHNMDIVIKPEELNRQHQIVGDKSWSTDQLKHNSSKLWKDCSVKTVFQFPEGDASTSYNTSCDVGEKEDGKRKAENDIRVIKEEAFGHHEPKAFGRLGYPITSENQKEELPRLPPIKLKSDGKPSGMAWVEKYECDETGSKIITADSTCLIGSFLDVPIGKELNSSGGEKHVGGNWLSVSHGITTIGAGLCESIDYLNEYWDSDEYNDDEDIGYTRQPIEDETWFLAHEIDYPSDNEKGTGHGNSPDLQERGPIKNEDDDQSFAEEDSYLSGDQYFLLKNDDPVINSDDRTGPSLKDTYGRTKEHVAPVWQGFVTQADELVMFGEDGVLNESGRLHFDDLCLDDYQHESVRSIGVGIHSDVADFGSEVRESLAEGSSEGDLEYFRNNDVGISPHDPEKKNLDRAKKDKRRIVTFGSDKPVKDSRSAGMLMNNVNDGGFSFPPPRDGQLSGSTKALSTNNNSDITSEETDNSLRTLMGEHNLLPPWSRKNSDSSLVKSSKDEDEAYYVGSIHSSPSTLSNSGYAERAHLRKQDSEKVDGTQEDPGASLEDEEAAAVQEQVKQIMAQEEDYETFNLKVVHRKNRTGFEEDKNFHVVLNSVIAGRYHVTEYLGSAAFSKAIQAHDLHTSMDVCVKIIKNNKDFFDQSLDEIKLLKFVNRHDPGDKYHLLRLYDYFYYREHLLIVCELLKANLYEFQKFNRESGGEVYFTMPRLQSIAIQCLEALQFLHGIGLIHCDLKPENILVKSYSRCEVKVIDLGSSCFETDHLSSYVQSRSYRAPEVILGLPYDKKIDIWSLGCILAELCTGNVLFQNDSPATLLARMMGIISPIDQTMLAKGHDTYKYFSKNHMLYERNQDTNKLEYLIPKKTSLRYRLPMADPGFIDFVSHLLEINPKKRPSATKALKHPWLSHPYEPISS